jgi:hypothetical protein
MITLKDKFCATLILDELLIMPNLWEVTVDLEPNPAFVDDPSSYNTAVDRIQVYIESMLDNSIFVSPEHVKHFMSGIPLNGVVHTTPDIPYDHILTICLFTKFSSIAEGRCIVTNVKLESYQGQGVAHTHGVDDGDLDVLRTMFSEDVSEYAEYWFDSHIKFFELSPDSMVLQTLPWEKFHLEFQTDKTGDVVQLDTFRPSPKKQDDDDNNDNIA